MPTIDLQPALDEMVEEIRITHERIVKTRRLETYLAHRENIAPMPDGASLQSKYCVKYGYVSVSVPEVEGRAWRGMEGTAGIIARVRMHLGVKKLTRSIDYDGNVTFNGYFRVGPTLTGDYWSVNINVGKQLPDSCELVVEEVEKVQTVKVYRTVCK